MALIVLLATTAASSIRCKSPAVQAAEIPDTPPDTASITLLFSGDVMQHGPQIDAARINDSSYSYVSCFQYVSRYAQAADIALANLEVTLAGPPYTGYPQFSAPDQLAFDLKNAGYHYLITANNHSCDRGQKGLERTLTILDSAGIRRTGTFSDSGDYQKNNPLVVEQKGFRLAILNYTYGTNGLAVYKPNIVNMLDTSNIKKDLEMAKSLNIQKIIVCVHWGNEYERLPSVAQRKMADFMFRHGVDYIIGSHPHVIQPMHRFKDSLSLKEKIVVYSLGNFVSNQRKPDTDGGASFFLHLAREHDSVYIRTASYMLHWVDVYYTDGKKHYEILPVQDFEHDSLRFDKERGAAFSEFINRSRELMKSENQKIEENR